MPKKQSTNSPVAMICIYGIWDIQAKRLVYINLVEEETELEYDMEGYNNSTHVVIRLNAACDISSLEPISP